MLSLFSAAGRDGWSLRLQETGNQRDQMASWSRQQDRKGANRSKQYPQTDPGVGFKEDWEVPKEGNNAGAGG